MPTDLPPAPWDAMGRRPTLDEQCAELEAPARSPADYALPQGFLGEDVDAEALTHGAAVRSLLWSAGFPVHEGAGLLHDLAEAERRFPDEPDDFAFATMTRTTEATLRRTLGDAEFDRRRAALTVMFAEMDRKSGGKLGEFIEEHAHLLAQPLVYARLLAHAGRADKRRR